MTLRNKLEYWNRDTGFPHYLKVECSHENFYKLKWYKAKKQLSLVYMENFLKIPRLQKEPLLGFSNTLGRILP